jgi:hypothetical protein
MCQNANARRLAASKYVNQATALRSGLAPMMDETVVCLLKHLLKTLDELSGGADTWSASSRCALEVIVREFLD